VYCFSHSRRYGSATANPIEDASRQDDDQPDVAVDSDPIDVAVTLDDDTGDNGVRDAVIIDDGIANNAAGGVRAYKPRYEAWRSAENPNGFGYETLKRLKAMDPEERQAAEQKILRHREKETRRQESTEKREKRLAHQRMYAAIQRRCVTSYIMYL